METFSLYEREDQFDPFTDILFNGLLGFVFMFMVAFLLINPPAESGKVDTDAQFLITVAWPDEHPDDIDTYVEDPAGNIVWYHVKEAGLMHLDRDDRGNYRDTITINGERIVNPLNQETVSIRGFVAGEFVVNVYHYVASSADPVTVTIKVERVNPVVDIVYYRALELDHRGHERTAVRFTIDHSGNVLNVSTVDRSLVRRTRQVKG